MTHSTAVSRLTVWKTAVIALLAAAATLALATQANAAVFFATPGSPSSLAANITSANTNGDAVNTIVLGTGLYQPGGPLPAITTGPGGAPKTLVITSHHADQVGKTGGPPSPGSVIDGTSATNQDSDTIVINAGVNVVFQGFTIRAASGPNHNTIINNGNLQLWNMFFTSNQGANTIQGGDNSSTRIFSSTFNGNNAPLGLITNSGVGGTLFFNQDTLYKNTGGPVVVGPSEMHNTVDAINAGVSCDTLASPASGNLNDGSCGGQAVAATDPKLANPGFNGGPAPTTAERTVAPVSPGIAKGDPAFRLTTDGRFFPFTGNPDIGAYQANAARETTPPVCVVNSTVGPNGVIPGPPAKQQVVVQDTLSGLGPVLGSFNDPLSTSANPPVLQSPTIDSDAINGLGIQNGTVAFFSGPNTAPSTTPVVLQATKADQNQLTSWWFTAVNWAGVSKFCK